MWQQPTGFHGPRRQRGVTTLAIVLILLVVITAMVLFSSTVGFFEQRTATNLNRARIVQQASDYAISLAGEYFKANRDRLISDDPADSGWFAAGSERWAKCMDVVAPPEGHPCLSERDAARRAELYFWTADGTVGGSRALPYTSVVPAAVQVEAGTGGAADFATTTEVNALLCRLDTSDPANVECALEPASGNRIAITLVARASLTGESADAEIKEAWATYNSFVPSAAVPLVASGLVEGLGNAQIVAAPNAGGYGLPASIWTPKNANIEASGGGGIGSVSTCHLGDFLKGTPEDELKTTCATTSACSCDGGSSSEFLSGHVGSIKREAEDILDVDGGVAAGIGVLPDIQFFPGDGMDKAGDPTDDSLFEYTFAVDYVVAEDDATGTTLVNCGDGGSQNCFDYAMREEFDAAIAGSCGELNTDSAGVIYVPTGCDDIPNDIGSPDSPVILVLNQSGGKDLTLSGNAIVYGMLFLHSDDQTATLSGAGSMKVFGALVVEGSVDIAGNLTIVYDDTSISGDTNKLPASARFGRVSGSWLDAATAF